MKPQIIDDTVLANQAGNQIVHFAKCGYRSWQTTTSRKTPLEIGDVVLVDMWDGRPYEIQDTVDRIGIPLKQYSRRKRSIRPVQGSLLRHTRQPFKNPEPILPKPSKLYGFCAAPEGAR